MLKEWNCALCDQHPDTIKHLCSCINVESEWMIICSKLISMTNRFKNKHNLDFDGATLIRTLLPNDRELLTLTEFTRHNWLRGIIHASTVATITKATKKHRLTHELILKIINKIQKLFRLNIWKKRCSLQKDKEAASGINISNITKEQRRARRLKILSRNRCHTRNNSNPNVNSSCTQRMYQPSSQTIQDLDKSEDDEECLCLDDLPTNSAAPIFRPDYKGMARDWYIDGMNTWLNKGLKASWMYIKDGSIGKMGKNLVYKYLLRTDTAETDNLN
jgi:hypothetical protein